MKRILYWLLVLLPFLGSVGGGFSACSEEDATWDPYYNWEARNARWFEQIADSARTAIAQAKRQYGDRWEDHCHWRMFKTLLRSADLQGDLTDSICVHILSRGTGTISPAYTDTVGLSFRGWLMETEYEGAAGQMERYMSVFTQTYYGSYNPATAAIQVMSVSGTVEGYCTALQYMVEGDDWLVYIPQKLGYAEKESSVIPAFSTLLFRLKMERIFEAAVH